MYRVSAPTAGSATVVEGQERSPGDDSERHSVGRGHFAGAIRRGQKRLMVAGEVEGDGTGALVQAEQGARGEQGVAASLRDQYALHQVEQLLALVPAEYEGTPGDPQEDSERGGIGGP